MSGLEYQPMIPSQDMASVEGIFEALKASMTPVLIHPYWQKSVTDQVLAQIPLWPRPTRPSLVVFTSGTSGLPKPCLLSLEALEKNAEMSNQNLQVTSSDRWLLNLPLFHVGGLGIMFRCRLAGAKLSFGSALDEAITIQSVVPTQLYRLLPRPPKRRVWLLGGAPVSRDLMTQILALKLPVVRTYGMTEMCSQVTATSLAFSEAELQTSGRPLPGVELKLVDQRIWVRSPAKMSGYLPALDSFDWFQTSDLGELTEHGLKVLGRADRAFKCGGELIQPEQIERALLNIPGVRQVRVDSQEDPEYGRVPVCYLETDLDRKLVLEVSGLKGLFKPQVLKSWSERPVMTWKDGAD